MDAAPCRDFGGLCRDDVPPAPGVYALYRDGRRVYLGKAADLRDRVWGNHSRRGQSLAASALRRNVAELLGFGYSADIKARRVRPSSNEVDAVRRWLDGCGVAWLECEDELAAVTLESALKEEFRPPLTKR